jgi:hypothetical protein
VGLFKYEDGKVDLDLEIKLIPEFRILIANDKDRFKKTALMEFAFIYFMYDYKSPYYIYDETERFEKVKKECGFEKDWKVHKKLQDAIDKYIELQETPTIKSLKAIKDSLLTSSKVIRVLQKNIESRMNDEIPDDDDDLVDKVEKLLKLSDKLPSAIDSISRLEEKIKAEQSTNTKIRGGGNIGYFEE